MPPLLEIHHLKKRFGDTLALADVSLTVNAGEIHAVLGENGAGKTTLMNILYGLVRADSGEIKLAGKPFRPAGPAAAIRAGIGMIHQHFMLVPTFTVMENFLLGNSRFGMRGKRRQRAQAEVLALCRRLGIEVQAARRRSFWKDCRERLHIHHDENVAQTSCLQAGWKLALRLFQHNRFIQHVARFLRKGRYESERDGEVDNQSRPPSAGFSLDSKIAELSVGQRQRVEIIKILLRHCRLLILDEPTAVLAPQEVEELFALLRRLRSEGYAMIFISHKIHEVLAVSDRLTVLRSGRVTGRFNTAEASLAIVAAAITPQDFAPAAAPAARAPGRVVLRAQALRAHGTAGQLALADLSFELHAGEILGVAGVDGNGQAELAEVLLGLRPLTDGRLELEGEALAGKSTRARLAAGLAHIPADRHEMGLFPTLSVVQNATALVYRERPFHKGGWLRPARLREYCERLVRDFEVRVTDPNLPVSTLSGGNQQKLVVGRELARRPKVLVAVNPTRGVDLSATAKIHQEILTAKAQGAAILLISTELGEVYALADRIGVLYRGRFAGIFPPDLSPEEIGALMLGKTGNRD
ncbi:MAG: ABC transporter ATP-binding protein [candidate division KSB1 bacterium]|nr:ABC transporter ATP-binding protein [candidate division KSB1 bacterium]MDZ7274394.1 ABC transporter ATP-binding protein [candidate division KSB1 bacterium]MDZ7284944.1 ABC transporter ATP-binding protein [candidate division KSB1 bacterium]MDZ7297635.1 ABC transporter ATP-binding protein [candidate division KSB1 bacterium]MDZ7348502.1 ABC transporter ATP-binding protein [candidate division KSB1 bacterium]